MLHSRVIDLAPCLIYKHFRIGQKGLRGTNTSLKQTFVDCALKKFCNIGPIGSVFSYSRSNSARASGLCSLKLAEKPLHSKRAKKQPKITLLQIGLVWVQGSCANSLGAVSQDFTAVIEVLYYTLQNQ